MNIGDKEDSFLKGASIIAEYSFRESRFYIYPQSPCRYCENTFYCIVWGCPWKGATWGFSPGIVFVEHHVLLSPVSAAYAWGKILYTCHLKEGSSLWPTVSARAVHGGWLLGRKGVAEETAQLRAAGMQRAKGVAGNKHRPARSPQWPPPTGPPPNSTHIHELTRN